MGLRVATDHDVIVLGGGPAGCAIARDAAGRGLTVALYESGDLGGSVAGQLILSHVFTGTPVPEGETDALRRICPHLIQTRSGRGYGFLARLMGQGTAEAALHPNAQRFAILCARDAAERGAIINPRVSAQAAEIAESVWAVSLSTGVQTTAQLLVDTTGGGVPGLPSRIEQTETYVVNLFSADDGRATSTIPFGNSLAAQIDAEPDPSALWSSEPITVAIGDDRGFHMSARTPALITTHATPARQVRWLAEKVVAEMAPYVNMIGKAWTRFAPLPGGDFAAVRSDAILHDLICENRHVTEGDVVRLFGTYGTDAQFILTGPQGHDFGCGLKEAEVSWLKTREWATSAQDIIWRRTALGPALTAEQVTALNRYLAA